MPRTTIKRNITPKDKVIADSPIIQTDDYSKFVVLPGNRRVDSKHVKQLARKMVLEGNLTQVFPIIVNERMEVIDGQHRLEALRQLNWPAFYQIKPGLTIETVQSLNTGTKNWTWFDYAFSFSQRGNDNYTRFLNLWDHFNLPYSIIQIFVGTAGGTKSKTFRSGQLVLDNHEEAFRGLKQYQDIIEAANFSSTYLARAVYHIIHLPNYDHERMVKKIEKYGGELHRFRGVHNFMRALEDIYNTYVHEDEKVRLF